MDCPICQESMDTPFFEEQGPTTETTTRQRCGHASHSKCLAEWWSSQKKVGCYFRCNVKPILFSDEEIHIVHLPDSFLRYEFDLTCLSDVWTLTDEQCGLLTERLTYICNIVPSVFITTIGEIRISTKYIFAGLMIVFAIFHGVMPVLGVPILLLQTLSFLYGILESIRFGWKQSLLWKQTPHRRQQFWNACCVIIPRNTLLKSIVANACIFLLTGWIRYGYLDTTWIGKLSSLFHSGVSYWNAA